MAEGTDNVEDHLWAIRWGFLRNVNKLTAHRFPCRIQQQRNV